MANPLDNVNKFLLFACMMKNENNTKMMQQDIL